MGISDCRRLLVQYKQCFCGRASVQYASQDLRHKPNTHGVTFTCDIAFCDTHVHHLTSLVGTVNETDDAIDEASTLSLDSISPREHTKQRQMPESAAGTTTVEDASTPPTPRGLSNDPSSSSAADLEEEASSEGAFNPETGEIN